MWYFRKKIYYKKNELLIFKFKEGKNGIQYIIVKINY